MGKSGPCFWQTFENGDEIMREIYLDNSATTQVAEPAAKAVYEMLVSCYGNPSSLHRKGLEAENRITAARKSLAKLLDCDPAEITFTSGGTEANNLALLGVAEARAVSYTHLTLPTSNHV